MRDRSHDEAMAEVFKKDPQYAIDMLNSILEDGELDELLITLRQVSLAFGGSRNVAKKAGVNETQIYRMLSEKGNPGIRNLSAILGAMGMRLAVKPISQHVA
ncbi:DNA-binding protein [Shewanella sp. YIC-542]|uniref:helix-turn-helix domain-containing transcriptional regulator n=1 Tax=Shewanella mytili TaxID=3377111 RepID=UPI00398F4C80